MEKGLIKTGERGESRNEERREEIRERDDKRWNEESKAERRRGPEK